MKVHLNQPEEVAIHKLMAVFENLNERDTKNPGDLREQARIYASFRNRELTNDQRKIFNDIGLQLDYLTDPYLNPHLVVPGRMK